MTIFVLSGSLCEERRIASSASVFDKPITKKPAETRMGSGKGAVEYYVAVIRPGRVLFEMGGISEEEAKEALRLAAFNLPIKTKLIKRYDPISGQEIKFE